MSHRLPPGTTDADLDAHTREPYEEQFKAVCPEHGSFDERERSDGDCPACAAEMDALLTDWEGVARANGQFLSRHLREACFIRDDETGEWRECRRVHAGTGRRVWIEFISRTTGRIHRLAVSPGRWRREHQGGAVRTPAEHAVALQQQEETPDTITKTQAEHLHRRMGAILAERDHYAVCTRRYGLRPSPSEESLGQGGQAPFTSLTQLTEAEAEDLHEWLDEQSEEEERQKAAQRPRVPVAARTLSEQVIPAHQRHVGA